MPDEVDPIDEALAAVDAQFTSQERELDSDATPDEPLAYDPEVVTAEADDADLEPETLDEPEPAQALPWHDPASPYYPQFLAYQQSEQQRQELQARETRTQQFLDLLRTAKENEGAQALYKQLEEVDPQMAQQYLGQRTGLMQRAQNAEQQRLGTLNGAAAMHLAMEDVLGDSAVVQQVVARSRELLATGGLRQMQMAVQTRQQAAAQQTQREAALAEENRTLKLQLAARQRRQSGVDRVDPAQGRSIRGKTAAETETFDDFWEEIAPGLSQHFGWGA